VGTLILSGENTLLGLTRIDGETVLVGAGASGGGGRDTAYLFDSAGDDSLVVIGTIAKLTQPAVTVQVDSFAGLVAYATTGNDRYDFSAPSFVIALRGRWVDG
jgi:hypothetical protein